MPVTPGPITYDLTPSEVAAIRSGAMQIAPTRVLPDSGGAAFTIRNHSFGTNVADIAFQGAPLTGSNTGAITYQLSPDETAPVLAGGTTLKPKQIAPGPSGPGFTIRNHSFCSDTVRLISTSAPL